MTNVLLIGCFQLHHLNPFLWYQLFSVSLFKAQCLWMANKINESAQIKKLKWPCIWKISNLYSRSDVFLQSCAFSLRWLHFCSLLLNMCTTLNSEISTLTPSYSSLFHRTSSEKKISWHCSDKNSKSLRDTLNSIFGRIKSYLSFLNHIIFKQFE